MAGKTTATYIDWRYHIDMAIYRSRPSQCTANLQSLCTYTCRLTTDIKKLADFEGTSIPLSSEIFENIINKKNITNIKNEFEILIINDFLEIEKIYQNNLYKRNIQLKTGYTKIQKNKCINRSLPIWKIDMNSLILQT